MPMEADRRDGGVASTNLQPGTRRRWAVSTTLWLLYPQEKPGTYSAEDWVGLGARLNDTENLASTGIQSPDHPAHRKSLYQLRYPSCLIIICLFEN
jgi:hypothetical protein